MSSEFKKSITKKYVIDSGKKAYESLKFSDFCIYSFLWHKFILL